MIFLHANNTIFTITRSLSSLSQRTDTVLTNLYILSVQFLKRLITHNKLHFLYNLVTRAAINLIFLILQLIFKISVNCYFSFNEKPIDVYEFCKNLSFTTTIVNINNSPRFFKVML